MTHKTNGLLDSIVVATGRFLSLFALFTIFVLPMTLKAQTAGEGTITGTVRDSAGAVVVGATVTATNASTNISTTRTTSSSGSYTIAPLPPAVYSLQVSAK